jgi:hypothetical protein
MSDKGASLSQLHILSYQKVNDKLAPLSDIQQLSWPTHNAIRLSARLLCRSRQAAS